MKKIVLTTLLITTIFLTTGCFGRRTTTVIECESPEARVVTTLEARGDRVTTWEQVNYYDRDFYFEVHGYESDAEVREWFRGDGPRLSTSNINGITFELVDITSTQVITRTMFDYTIISRDDMRSIIGDSRADYISLSASVDSQRTIPGCIIR